MNKGMSAAIKVVQIHAAVRKDQNEKKFFLQLSPEKMVIKFVVLLINREEI